VDSISPTSHSNRTIPPRAFHPPDLQTVTRAHLPEAIVVGATVEEDAPTIAVGVMRMVVVEVARAAMPRRTSARCYSIVTTAVQSTRMVSRMAPIAL
jgi:hypothetical protein